MGWRTREEKLAYLRKYYQKNRKRLLEMSRQWAKNNPEKRREISRRHSRKKGGVTKESLAKSATWKGRQMELYALKNFFIDGVDMNSRSMGGINYDIEWKGLKIDVKSKELYKGKSGSWWSFATEKKDSVDYYFCICKKDNIPVRHYLIPSNNFGKSGVTIGLITKFKEYEVSNSARKVDAIRL